MCKRFDKYHVCDKGNDDDENSGEKGTRGREARQGRTLGTNQVEHDDENCRIMTKMMMIMIRIRMKEMISYLVMTLMIQMTFCWHIFCRDTRGPSQPVQQPMQG